MSKIHVIGGGLAGSEAAWQAAEAGVDVVLHEMRPVKPTDAHHTAGFAELVCSNSFRSDDHEHNAVGLLHEEMRRAGSLIMACADKCALPAGGALAVDRDGFSQMVSEALEANPRITIAREEIAGLPPAEWDNVIVATGPLTSPALAAATACSHPRAALLCRSQSSRCTTTTRRACTRRSDSQTGGRGTRRRRGCCRLGGDHCTFS